MDGPLHSPDCRRSLQLQCQRRPPAIQRYNLEDALVGATFLNSFLNFADVVKMANMAQLVNVIAPMFTDEKRLFLQTTFFPLELFSRNSRGTALDLFVDSPTYKTKKYDA